MILVDANILLYAYDKTSVFHEKARPWWEDRLSEPHPVRLAWATIFAFIRISTHARLLAAPLLRNEATEIVDTWLRRPMVDTLEPTHRHWELVKKLIVSGQAGGNLVPDAHLAALAIEHGASLYSTDRDFSRFDGLTLVHPFE